MNIFDIIIVLLILLSGVVGFKKGILREGIMFLGTIIIYIISFKLKGIIGLLLCRLFPFFKLDGLPTLNIFIYQLVGFVIVASILFGIFGFVMKATGVLQKLVDITIVLTLPSKILGFIVGLIEGYIVLFIIFMILSIPLRNFDIFKESKLVNNMLNNSPILTSTLGNLDDAIMDIYSLTNKIEYKDENNINQVNLEIMGTYIKYNIISKDDAKIIIDTGKLDDISNIKSYVNNY